MTSLAFMLVWVPDPVCQTRSGNSASCFPSATSAAACAIACARCGSSRPSSAFVSAAACLMTPSAWMIGAGIRSSPIAKFCKERWVCAPQ